MTSEGSDIANAELFLQFFTKLRIGVTRLHASPESYTLISYRKQQSMADARSCQAVTTVLPDNFYGL
jgi:hypothetical protein